MSSRPKIQIVYANSDENRSTGRSGISTTSSETTRSIYHGNDDAKTTFVRRYVGGGSGGADAHISPAASSNVFSAGNVTLNGDRAPGISIFQKRIEVSEKITVPVPTASLECRRPSADKVNKVNKVCEEFEKIKQDFQRTRKPWEDPKFPADIKSVYPSTPTRKIDWKRPHEICSAPMLITEGVSRFDVQQGELGDCWVLAAVASLSMHKELFDRVVPDDQDFDKNYCGAFHFRFWKFGDWVDIIVDDRLPVDRKELLFMHSVDKVEFWSALLEKAYAKLNTCYENLIGGVQSEAMEDFTGGLCETMNLTDWKGPKSHFVQLTKYITMSSLIGCSIDAADDEIEETLPNGLIVGHAYSVTDAKVVKHRGTETELVRVRNPWGDSAEWNGAWSDGSAEWKTFSEAERKALGIVFVDDGEFWMAYKDFVENFTKLEVCHLGPESLDDPEMTASHKKKVRWEMTMQTGSWVKNVNAGGCRNFIASFWTNPQFVVDVIDPDKDDTEDKGHIIIGLMQKDMRSKHLDFWTIGYSLYKLPPNHSGMLDQKFFRVNKMADKSPQYVNQREITGRHVLDPGKYAIVPSTFSANEEAEFIIRIFSQLPNESGELDTQSAMQDVKIAATPNKKSEDETRLEALKVSFYGLSGPLGRINACHLKDILNTALNQDIKGFVGFNTEVCRSMVALMDLELSGKMNFNDFTNLWRNLQIWKKVFMDYDADKSGTFDAFELRQALVASGFRVSNRLFAAVANRYTDPEKGQVSFEDYILLVTRLKNAFETFKNHKGKQEDAVFTEDDYLYTSLYI